MNFTVCILVSAGLAVVLAALVRADLRDRRLPDALTLPLILAGLAWNGWAAGALPAMHLLGAVLGYGVFAAIGGIYFRLRGIDGLGLGDAKLLAATGAWFGALALPWAILLATVPALIWAVSRGRGARDGLAFGPWLAGAFWLLWLAQIAGWSPG